MLWLVGNKKTKSRFIFGCLLSTLFIGLILQTIKLALGTLGLRKEAFDVGG